MEQNLDTVEFTPAELLSEVLETRDVTETIAAAGPKVAACLIEYARGRYIALPPHTTYGLIESPEFVRVPGAAGYAYGLLTWQESRVPLLDINALVHGELAAVQNIAPRYALIVGYQCIPRGPLEYGAIALAVLPKTIAIGDEAQCELPADSPLWPLLALSCFQYEGNSVAILDSARLFAANHADFNE